MASVFPFRMRRAYTRFTRPAKRRPFRHEDASRLFLESLEDRTLLTTWQDIAGVFNSGVLSAGIQTTTLASSAFNVAVPLVQSSLSQALDVPSKVLTPFGVKLDPNQTDLNKVAMDLQSLGFTVERLDVDPDPTTHDLVRLSKDFTVGASQAAFGVGGIGGALGFKYFDDHVAGGLNAGTIQANVSSTTFHIHFGVDLVGTQPQFFLLDSTRDANGKFTGLDSFTVSGQTHLTGRMNLRNLLNVQIAGDAILGLSAGLSFKSLDPSHKLHLPDLNANNVLGTLTGSAKFANVSLSTQLPLLPALQWTGNFVASIATDALGHKTITPTESTVAPDVWGIFQNLVGGLFNITPSLGFLSPLAGALNTKIPLFDFTLGEKLGLGDVSAITGLAANIGSTLQDAETALNRIGIFVGIPPGGDPGKQPKSLTDLANLVSHVIQGDKVDLLSFSKSGGNRWGQNFCFTFLSLGVPGVADVHLDACFGGYVGWDYSVGFGIDTTGFYIDPRTHIGINGGIYAGLHGGLRVLGFDIAEANGRIGLDASARLSIRNPDPSQSDRIYLDEIFKGGNVFQSILNALQVDFTLDVTAHVDAKISLDLGLFSIDITLFSQDWNLARLVDLHIPVATTQSQRAVRLNLLNQDLAQDPSVNFSNGVLTLDGRGGTVANPNLVLLSGKDGAIDANWPGHGMGHFSGVQQVKFLGGSGNDVVKVSPGFNVPIYAQGGSGSNYFEAGDGNSTLLGGGSAGQRGATLIGGAGHDWLQGGPGDDQILGGSGDSTLIGGPGNDLLRAGLGNDLLLGGTPADPAHPEKGTNPNDPATGSAILDGGLRNSTLWAGTGMDTLIAGSGADQLHGGKGDALMIGGLTADPTANPPVVLGGGDDTIWAGSGNNTIRGGQGNDTIYGAPQGTFTVGGDGHLSFTTVVTSHNIIQGGSGNNLIYGGPNNDLLIAGTGNDRLYSNSDLSHKTTLVAGPGEDWLYAGQGDDLLRLPFGVNANGVRSHFVGGPGHDILAVTTDAADHYIRLTQSSATNFTATSYADPGETQPIGSFNFEVPSDLHGNFINTLALEAITGNNKLDVAPEVRKNVLLKGGNGNDTLVGGGGNNTLMGGTGNDLLQGGPGTNPGTYNEFHGGTGSTTMIGGAGADIFYGGTGDNLYYGGTGRVTMHGGMSLPGQRNHDTMHADQNLLAILIAGTNDVTMYGGPVRNVLLGGSGNAEMHAGDGDSVLTGGTGPVTMYGGSGYDELIGGQGTNVLYADDPTRQPSSHSSEDWQTRFLYFHNELDVTRDEEVRLTALINDPNTPPDEKAALEMQKAAVIQEDGLIADALAKFDFHYAMHPNGQNPDTDPMTRYYDNPNVLIGGAGATVIHGSTFPNYIIAGSGPTTIYSGGAADTVTGTAGKDTFFIPPLPGNSNIVFGATDDGHGNPIPVVHFQSGAVDLVEQVHVRGISQIGVITGAGNNTVTVDLGGHVINGLDGINVQCTTGNNLVNVTNFPGRVTVQAGSGTDTVLGGSAAGLELDGGSGLSIYKVDGDGVRVLPETWHDPNLNKDIPVLAIYVNAQSQPQTRITKTTFRRLSIQGRAGNNPIILGAFGNYYSPFYVPELIASAGPGNKTIDASAVTNAVTLEGGAGNDTLIGSRPGPNYFLGGTGETLVQNYTRGYDTLKSGGGPIRYEGSDDFESYPVGYRPDRWLSTLVNTTPGEAYGVQVVTNGPSGKYMWGTLDMRVQGRVETLNLFSGTDYVPSVQGPITSLDLGFDFKTLYCSWSPDCDVGLGFAVQQGGFVFRLGTVAPKANQNWAHLGFNSVDQGRFNPDAGQRNPPPHPDFSSSGAPLQFGFITEYTNLITSRIYLDWGMDNFHVVFHSAPTPPVAASFRVTPVTLSPTAGSPFNFTVTALDAAGNPLPGYRGTVHFAGNDPTGLLPADYTFTATDSGVHTFFAILKTAGPRSVTVTQTDAAFVSGTVALTVLPAATDHFQVATSTGTATAGSLFTLTVRALDAYGNVATGYRGTVHFTSTAAQATLPGDYTFTAGDNGSKSFTVTLATAAWQAITVVDTANRTLAGTVPTVTRYPVLSQTVFNEQLIVAGPDGNVWFTEYGPNKIGRMRPDGGVTEFTIPTPNSNPTGITVGPDGNIWFLERYGANGSRSGANVGRITLDGHFTEFPVGVADLFDITTGPDGNLWFTSAGGQRIGRIHPDGTGLTWFSLAGDAQPYRITVGPDGNLWFTSHVQNVLRRITLDGHISDFPLPTGVPRCVGITAGPGASLWLACDRANEILQFNVSAGFTQYRLPPGTNPRDITTSGGNLWFTNSNVVRGMTPAGVMTQFVMGTPDAGINGITRAADGSLWFTLASLSQVGRLAPGVAIVPAAAGGFSVTAAPNSVAAGATLSVTVTARDPYGNVATGYRGTVHAPISDGQASSDYTFTAADNGSHTFTITLTQAGSRIVSVSDTQGLTGNTTVNVTPLAAVSLSITSTQAPAVAGVLYPITVSARDQYNNIATGYRGTVYFGGTDGQCTLPATYTFTGADQGAKTFAVVLRTAGPQTLRATDTANALLRASLDTVVSPAAAAYFSLVSLTNPITAGTAFTLTVTAYDAFGNVATGYRGTVSFSSNDGGATLPGNATFTAADSGSKSFTVTLRTAGWRSFMVVDTANSGLRGSGPVVTELPVVTPGGHPHGITLGPDGNLWFNERSGNTIDRLTPAGINTTFAIPTPNSLPDIIITGPDGNLWFTEHASGEIGRITPAGVITEFPALNPNADLVGLVVGPDGNLWFTGRASNLIGRITPQGTATVFTGKFSAGFAPNKLTPGPDHTDLWVSSFSGGRVARITITANGPSVTEFAVPAGSQEVITAGPDGAIWVTLPQANEIVKVGTDGRVASTFAAPTPDSFPFGITGGSDGNVWFTEAQGNKVGRISGAGITEFPLATLGGQPWFITTGPDGNLWFTELAGDKIGRVGPGMLVVPAAANHFGVSAAPSAVTAGAPLSVTVTAYDAFGNIVNGYTGTVHFSSSDAQAVLPADYTFTAADHGTHTFSITLKTAGSQTLTVLDTVKGSISGTTAVTVRPGAARWLQLTGLPTTIAAGAHFSVTVTARDTYGNVATGYTGTVHFSPAADATLPPDYHFMTGPGGDNGTHTFTDLIYRLAGNRSLTVSDNGNGLMVTGMFQVTPAAASHFQVAGFPSPVTAGVSGTFTVTALDPFGNVDVNYRGTVTFSSTDTGTQVMLPPNYPFSASDNGVHRFMATLVTAGTQSLTAADSQFPQSINGSQGGILVVAAAPDHFAVATSVDGSSTVARTPFDVTVTVQDLYGNTVTGYTGTVTFSSQDPYGATLPDDYIFQSSDMGHATFSGVTTLYTAGVWDVTAMDTANSAITGSANVTVTPAAAVQFQVTTSVDGGSVIAGTPFDVTVTALDPYGNIDTNYQGTIHLSSTDPQLASLPPDYSFTIGDGGDNGIHTFAGSAIFYTAGTWEVRATDTADDTITGIDLVSVTPASANHFLIAAPATATAGVAFDVTLTALDRYGNVDVNYRGTVHFSTSDPGPGYVLPADYTFKDSDNGAAVFAHGFTLVTLGDQTITATDTASSLITGTATVTVQSPGPEASGAAGKGHGAVNGESVAPSPPATPTGIDATEGEASPRLLAHLGATDSAAPMLGLEPLAVVRRHRTPLGLEEALDQLFMEEREIG